MKALPVALVLLCLTAPLRAQEEAKPGPYVNVYHDDAVLFQMRRDRITSSGDELYRVWLRWLWAEPRPWKSDQETATVRFVDLDCNELRVRDLAVLHKNRKGEIFDAEEFEPEKSPWQSLQRESGAGAAMARVCEFAPKLLEAKREADRQKE
ncbi:MAG TPA: hypothetical protein VHL59_16325 [Thermoanaerobaculia bacterium]|nr:hypothetical protein [Thermoanaerobaculia bacterium]